MVTMETRVIHMDSHSLHGCLTTRKSKWILLAMQTKTVMEATDDLKASEAAKLLRCTRQTIAKLARSGELEGAYRLGRDIHVPRASVDAYKARRAVAAPQPRLTTEAQGIVTT